MTNRISWLAGAIALCASVYACMGTTDVRADGKREASRLVAMPTCILIGGGLEDDNETILTQLLIRNDVDKIVIVPYSSGEAQTSADSTIARFKARRPSARFVTLPDPSKDESSLKLAAEWIAHADLVYFTGGDQSRLIPRFLTPEGKPNAVLQSLQAGMLKWGTVVGGTSAGAAVMADPMFTGGGSESALAMIALPDGEGDNDKGASPPPAGVRMGKGLGLVGGVVIDTHTTARGRHGRMVAALEKTGYRFAIGLNENRGAIERGGTFDGLGEACAVIVDGASLKHEGGARTGVRVSLLGDKDRFSLFAEPGWSADGKAEGHYQYQDPAISGETLAALASLAVQSAEAKSKAAEKPQRDAKADVPVDAKPDEAQPTAERKAWGHEVLNRMIYDLARDPSSVQTARSERFEVRLSADERTRWFGQPGKPETLRVIDARMDIVERK